MNRKKILCLVTIMMVAFTNFCFSSCEKDDESDVSDPVGTIELDMRKKGLGETHINMGNWSFYINKSDNFQREGSVLFSDVGSVKGLSSINTIPNSGWATEIAVRPGHGYVIKDEYQNNYMRLYVIKYIVGANSGGVIGAAVKYQNPWK